MQTTAIDKIYDDLIDAERELRRATDSLREIERLTARLTELVHETAGDAVTGLRERVNRLRRELGAAIVAEAGADPARLSVTVDPIELAGALDRWSIDRDPWTIRRDAEPVPFDVSGAVRLKDVLRPMPEETPAERIVRLAAKAVIEGCYIVTIDDVAATVTSAVGPHLVYRVSHEEPIWCACPGFEYTGMCKHLALTLVSRSAFPTPAVAVAA